MRLMAKKEGRRAKVGTRSQAPEQNELCVSKIACLPIQVKHLLLGLATVCDNVATTQDQRVVDVGLALIARAPRELSMLMGGRV